MKTFKPQFYIKNNEKTQEYECVICNFIAEKPYTCNGPCHQNFCFQCVKVIKSNKNQCPFRCSQPFELTEGAPIALEFRCPFKPEECQVPIQSLAEFYDHSNVCKYLPEGWKEKEFNILNFKCNKDHDLFFLDQEDLLNIYGLGFYEAITNETCASCSQKGICRSICPQCSKKGKIVTFCTNCRQSPCTKSTCLYEHPLKKRECYSKSLVCDFCGTRVYLLGPNVFRDNDCNFDICQSCFVNLPESHKLVPFKMSKEVIKHLNKDKPSLYDYFPQLALYEEPIAMEPDVIPAAEHLEAMPIQNLEELGLSDNDEFQDILSDPLGEQNHSNQDHEELYGNYPDEDQSENPSYEDEVGQDQDYDDDYQF